MNTELEKEAEDVAPVEQELHEPLTPDEVYPVVLAAGASSRMGSPKAGLDFGGQTALARILETCAELGLGEPVVVTGAHPEETRAAAGDHAARFVRNARWETGRTSSLQRGLLAIPGDASAVLLWPVDACLPGVEVVTELVAALTHTPNAQAAVPCHDRHRGHPLLIGAEALPRFLDLGPDESARELVRTLAAEGRLVHVEVSEKSVLMNVNTPQDHTRWRLLAPRRRRGE
ncbi:MAG: nucleotidyltransferase family protein [Planctomycetes bacterium]|nr:nucleotidyltransferase family protein [Planctomycetota bacterium]